MKQRARRKRVQRIAFRRTLRPLIDELIASLYKAMEIRNKRLKWVLNTLQDPPILYRKWRMKFVNLVGNVTKIMFLPHI